MSFDLRCRALRGDLPGPLGDALTSIALTGLAAADPAEAVRRGLAELELDADEVALLSVGKAGPAMAEALVAALGERLVDGLVVGKRHGESPTHVAGLPAVFAEHPVPGARSERAGAEVAALLDRCRAAGEKRTLLVAISGGASALVASPREGISLADLAATTDALVRSGAEIQAINAVRKHLEELKGGGVVRRAAPAKVRSLIISDVVGDALDAIASGPTVPDPTTWEDVAAGLGCCAEEVPASVRALVERGLRGDIAETPKPGDAIFSGSDARLVASPGQAAAAAAARARGLGFAVEEGVLAGEARVVGAELAARARNWARQRTRRCLVLAGETTVVVRGSGKGGRNQELALAAAEGLAGVAGAAVLSLATDGEDGPTDAAGGVATGALLASAGADAVRYALARNDAYQVLAATDHLLRTGPTGTNVCDLVVVLVDPR